MFHFRICTLCYLKRQWTQCKPDYQRLLISPHCCGSICRLAHQLANYVSPHTYTQLYGLLNSKHMYGNQNSSKLTVPYGTMRPPTGTKWNLKIIWCECSTEQLHITQWTHTTGYRQAIWVGTGQWNKQIQHLLHFAYESFAPWSQQLITFSL
jgi:hypothetical protein